jgi:hypothetical protein
MPGTSDTHTRGGRVTVALDIADTGADVRMLAGWDSVAPYSLALSALPRLFFVAAIVAGLRRAGESPWLRRIGIVLLPVSVLGSATLLTGAAFPVLAPGTLATELWTGRWTTPAQMSRKRRRRCTGRRTA